MLLNTLCAHTCNSFPKNLFYFLKHGLIVQRLLGKKPNCSGHAHVSTKPSSVDWIKQGRTIHQNLNDNRSSNNSVCPQPLIRSFHRETVINGQEDDGSGGRQTSAEGLTLHNLTHRSLVCVEGPDSVNFLQGLLTNDVNLLGSDRPVQYSMMLNAQGRVLYDLILYLKDSKIFIECDAQVRDEFIKTIKKYKIRKKVEINKVDGEWMLQAVVTSSLKGNSASPTWNESVFCVTDPRVKDFGWRLIHHSSCDKVCAERIEEKDVSLYNERRYIWGISEGISDLPPGECLPLESNLTLFNGVSFDKGCYIGQELTARTQHTGVTRKRLMPLVFERVPSGLQPGCIIVRADGKNVGKYRSSFGIHGIGLIRIAEIKGELSVHSSDGDILKLTTHVPNWWPK
ncbi:putative transferase CAF17 homolog, mitochondrial [Gigantopelta aegis]|uniref:putative transferase CAF17 homolog, mitochondrial n=1 Tax=Gigantopelta aegis TaxID=1735272 RepID=UPI001B88B73A|nr:putative transferase CAF17 homolog, mitochondrial [Gigantopelta aegis]XP_041351567.1 putative transferase CAF17 homolog, mitochondrial [Gigantopelta aegis]